MSKTLAEARRPLLCIVDPSLKDFVGHHFEYDAAVAGGARDAGYEVVCLAHKTVQRAVSDVLPVRAAFTHDIWEARQLYADQEIETAHQHANRSFLADLDQATRDLALDERSIIFGHMITAGQLGGWAAFARRLRARRPTFVLLCRYELGHYRGETAARAFREIERLERKGVRIRLASDSERLARHYARLTSLPVEVFPIPHTQAHSPARPGPERAAGAPLVVSMLGNARDEKGWVELVAAIEILAAQGRAQAFRFVLQANDPDAACRRALARLNGSVAACIELKTEALDPADYAALLEDSDIVVLPYWRSVYEARTSGVLVEALSAGKPVICTEGTWLADQLDAGQGRSVKDRNPADLARQLWAMCVDYERYAKGAYQARPKWVDYHNPQSFVSALSGGAPPPAHGGLRVAAFYPWGDAHTKASGASLRFNLFARYLAARAAGVTVMEDAAYGAKLIDGISFEAYPLLQQGDASRLGRRLRRWAPKLFRMADGEELYLLLHLYPSFDRAFRRRLEEIVRSSDIVFLDYAFWAPVVAAVCHQLDKPLVITTLDVVADQIRSSPLARWVTARLEVYGLRKARSVAVVSEADRAAFARLGLATTFIPQFVDVDGLRAMPEVSREVLNRLIELPATDDAPLFVFVGSRFRPNQVAADHLRRIAAATRTKYPDLAFRIVVVGNCCAPTREDDFIALGFVDEAVLPILYQHAAVVVIPLTLGTGASLKTVEAFGAGAPVLGTSIAFRGFEIEPGVDCILEDDLEAWPDRVAELARAPARAHDLRAGAARRGDSYHFQRACGAYLALAPEIPPHPIIAADGRDGRRVEAILALVMAGWKAGLSDVVAPYLDDLRAARPNDGALMRIYAELLSQGDRLDVSNASDLFYEAFEVGEDIEASLYGLFKAAGHLGDIERQAWTATLAARLLALQAAHPDADAALRDSLWKRFHAGERSWVHAITQELASPGADMHMDYHYLLSLLETSDHELALSHAQEALSGGFDRYWCLMSIAAHQAALGRAQQAMDTWGHATEEANDEEQRRAVVDARLAKIWEFFHQRDLRQASEQIARLLIDAPELADAYYIKAECLRLMEGNPSEAIAHYERAEQLGHDPVWCRLHSGRLLADQRRLEEAGERLLSAFPGYEDAHRIQCWRDGLADVVRLGVGRMGSEDLREIVSRAALFDPTNRDLKISLDASRLESERLPTDQRRDDHERLVGSSFRDGDYRLSLALAREGYALFPDHFIFVYYMAECQQLLNEELDVAETYYSRALELDMAPFWPLMNRGQVRRKLQRYEEARADILAASEAARDDAERAQAAKFLADLQSQPSEAV